MIYPFPSSFSRIQLMLTKVSDSVANLRFAASCLQVPETAALLDELADCRQERIEDLSWLLLSHGVTPNRDVSRSFLIHRAWVRFIDQLLSPSDPHMIHECELHDRRLALFATRAAACLDSRSSRMVSGIAQELEADAELLNRIGSLVSASAPSPIERVSRPSLRGRTPDEGGLGSAA